MKCKPKSSEGPGLAHIADQGRESGGPGRLPACSVGVLGVHRGAARGRQRPAWRARPPRADRGCHSALRYWRRRSPGLRWGRLEARRRSRPPPRPLRGRGEAEPGGVGVLGSRAPRAQAAPTTALPLLRARGPRRPASGSAGLLPWGLRSAPEPGSQARFSVQLRALLLPGPKAASPSPDDRPAGTFSLLFPLSFSFLPCSSPGQFPK